MVRIEIFSLLALFFMASYASATTLEDVCKGTNDAAYCVKLLKHTVEPHTDFKSVTWRKVLISRATTRAMMAKDQIAKMKNLPLSNMDRVKLCGNKLESSINSLKQAAAEYDGKADVSKQLDSASADQQACSNALKDAVVQGIAALRALAEEATKATAIVIDVIKAT